MAIDPIHETHTLDEHLVDRPLAEAGVARTAVGGALMGIANIIPGVSGGTMILAVGLYEHFVDSIADITRLKWSARAFRFLGVLLAACLLAIGLATYPITYGLEHFHHLMYAMFIGLTLGGVPLLWKELRPIQPIAIATTVAGFLTMVAIAFFLRAVNVPQNFLTFVVAGIVASAAMVLPGISGSYLLLIFGLYYPVTNAIKGFIGALRIMDVGAAMTLAVGMLLPMGIGVLLGIGGLTNVLKALLLRFHQATVGGLLGLLVGSVAGLWPFGELKEKGETIAAAHPLTAGNIALVALLIAVGFVVTLAVSRLGGEKETKS